VGCDIRAIHTGENITVILDTFTVLQPQNYFALFSQSDYYPGEFSFDIRHGWLEPVNHDLYVSPSGNDENSGLSASEPLKTIAWALHLIAPDSLEPKTVYLASGDYSDELNEQIYPIGIKSFVSLIGDENMQTIITNNNIIDYNTISFNSGNHNGLLENIIFHDSDNCNTHFIYALGYDNLTLNNIVIENSIGDDVDVDFFYEVNNFVNKCFNGSIISNIILLKILILKILDVKIFSSVNSSTRKPVYIGIN
jgi:hypothetical protein